MSQVEVPKIRKFLTFNEKTLLVSDLNVMMFEEVITKLKKQIGDRSDNEVVKWGVDYILKNGKLFSIDQMESNFGRHGELEVIRLMVFNDIHTQNPLRSELFFSPKNLKEAISYFVCLIKEHVRTGLLFAPEHKAMTLDEIKIIQTKQLVYASHYDYLNEILNPFWKFVFGKTADQMFQGGIVVSHADKAYGYKDQWVANKIPFHHGVLLFLLSYTKLYGDRPKHECADWVVEVYKDYLEKIQLAEKQVLKDLFNIE